jgi:hypothetical protein
MIDHCRHVDALVGAVTKLGLWPAAGSVDTEIRCFRELEVGDATTEVYPWVQD